MSVLRLIAPLAILLTVGCTDPNGPGGPGGGSGDPVRDSCEGYVTAAFSCHEDAGATDLSATYADPDNFCAPVGQTAAYTAGIHACLESAYVGADCASEEGLDALSAELEACTGATI